MAKNHLVGLALFLLLLLATVVLVNKSTRLAMLPGSKLVNSEVYYLNSAQSFPRQILDPVGREVVLPAAPSAIVSVILAGDEMLSELVSRDRVRSVTYLADEPGISNIVGVYPESTYRNYGGVEEIIAAEPDLVIVAGYNNATSVEMLLSSGIPILRFANFQSYDHVRDNVRTLAKALGAETKAERWLEAMDQRIARVQDRVATLPKPRVLYYSLDGSTSGPGSLMDETIHLAGGVNVVAAVGTGAYGKISPELAISLMPDVILINDWEAEGGKSARQLLMDNPAWKDVPAVKNQRVFSVYGAWLTSGSPFRVNGVERVAELLHPESFALDGLVSKDNGQPEAFIKQIFNKPGASH